MNFNVNNKLVQIAMNYPEEFHTATEILGKYDTEFTIYSISIPNMLKVNDMYQNEELVSLQEFVDLIKESNSKNVNIENIINEKNTANRTIDKVENFFKNIIDVNNKDRLYMVIGETGVGKTWLIEKTLKDLAIYACNRDDSPYSLCYTLKLNEKGELAPYESEFLKRLKNGGIVFLDEMNELPHETLMFIQGISDMKESIVVGGESVKIHPNFKIIGALNPPSETDERASLGDALLGRSVGLLLELTDEIIIDRVGCTAKYLKLVRQFHLFMKSSGLDDIRELSFRDYKNLLEYDFETQFQYKMCIGSINNIKNYNKIKETGEYVECINQIYAEIAEIKKGNKNGR